MPLFEELGNCLPTEVRRETRSRSAISVQSSFLLGGHGHREPNFVAFLWRHGPGSCCKMHHFAPT